MIKRRTTTLPLLPVNLTQVTTSDGIELAGVVIEPKGRKFRRTGSRSAVKAAFIWVHGLTSSFDRGQHLMAELSRACTRQGIGYFKFNTRGHHLVDHGPSTRHNPFIGATHEKFRDAVKDIQSVIILARRLGYKKIILAGHSTGAQKVLYYCARRRDPRITGLILAGPASDIAGELKRIRPSVLLRRVAAVRRRANKHPNELVPADWGPWSNQRYLSLFTPGSVEEVFPYHRLGGRWTFLKNARPPILIISGEDDEYLDQPAAKLMMRFKKYATKTNSFRGVVIPGAGHSFRGHQREFTKHIAAWLRTVL